MNSRSDCQPNKENCDGTLVNQEAIPRDLCLNLHIRDLGWWALSDKTLEKSMCVQDVNHNKRIIFATSHSYLCSK